MQDDIFEIKSGTESNNVEFTFNVVSKGFYEFEEIILHYLEIF